ncbi:hypothetical protein GOV08_00580, partial [Candidatus Woesearchaeota archaeon]|nr:hypothetical protein [Candidatus Woesearchaeota archaeon]
MNKRGDITVYRELLTLIIAVILFFMLVKIFWNVFTPDEELQQTEKDVKRIVDEIRDLKDGDSISVPVM